MWQWLRDEHNRGAVTVILAVVTTIGGGGSWLYLNVVTESKSVPLAPATQPTTPQSPSNDAEVEPNRPYMIAHTVMLILSVVVTMATGINWWYHRMRSDASKNRPHPPAIVLAPTVESTTVTTSGNNSPGQVTGDITYDQDTSTSGDQSPAQVIGPVTYDNSNNSSGVDNEALKMILKQHEDRISEYKAQLDERDHTIDTLRKAVERVDAQAKQGNEIAQAAIEQAKQTGDPQLIQDVLVNQANDLSAHITEQSDEYVELAREIAAIAYLRGDIPAAEKWLGRILKNDPNDRDAINRMGRIHLLRGNFNAAIAACERIINLSQDDPVGQAGAYGNLGAIYQTRGDLEQAKDYLLKSLEINKQLDRLEGQAIQYSNLGVIYGKRNEQQRAEDVLQEALKIFQDLDKRQGQAGVYGNLGLIHLNRGDVDRAEEYHLKSLEINKQLGFLEGQADQYANLGSIYRERKNLDQAEEYYLKSLEINKQLGCLEGQANQYVNLGSIYLIRNDLGQTRKAWTCARALFEQIGMPHKIEKFQGLLDELPPQP